MHPIPLIAFVALALAGCSATEAPNPALAPLLDSIERRLDLAEAVALHKWDNAQPVQATQREQQVLANVQIAAPGHGLQPQRAEAFFADQIEANKLVQYTLLSQWHRRGSAPDTQRRDLRQEIRPQLDDLQGVLLNQLAAFDQQSGQDCDAALANAIAVRPTRALTRQALVRATGQLCEKP